MPDTKTLNESNSTNFELKELYKFLEENYQNYIDTIKYDLKKTDLNIETEKEKQFKEQIKVLNNLYKIEKTINNHLQNNINIYENINILIKTVDEDIKKVLKSSIDKDLNPIKQELQQNLEDNITKLKTLFNYDKSRFKNILLTEYNVETNEEEKTEKLTIGLAIERIESKLNDMISNINRFDWLKKQNNEQEIIDKKEKLFIKIGFTPAKGIITGKEILEKMANTTYLINIIEKTISSIQYNSSFTNTKNELELLLKYLRKEVEKETIKKTDYDKEKEPISEVKEQENKATNQKEEYRNLFIKYLDAIDKGNSKDFINYQSSLKEFEKSNNLSLTDIIEIKNSVNNEIDLKNAVSIYKKEEHAKSLAYQINLQIHTMQQTYPREFLKIEAEAKKELETLIATGILKESKEMQILDKTDIDFERLKAILYDQIVYREIKKFRLLDELKNKKGNEELSSKEEFDIIKDKYEERMANERKRIIAKYTIKKEENRGNTK